MEFNDSTKLVHLKLCSVFQNLSSDILFELAKQMTPRQLEPGEILLEEGVKSDSVFILAAGTLNIYKGTETQIIAQISPVSLIGEMEALSSENTPNFASVISDTAGAIALELSRAEFLEFLESQPEAMHSAIALTARNYLTTKGKYDETRNLPYGFEDRVKRFDSLMEVIENFRNEPSVAEYQKKFKVHTTPDQFLNWVKEIDISIKAKQLDQVYLPCLTKGGELRLRKTDDKCEISIARKLESGSRIKLEIPIDEYIYRELRPQAEGKPITKTRYTFKYEGLEWRFDVFAEHLSGLCLLEVSLKSKDAQFTLPSPFIGSEDVTGDPKYDNKSLALERMGT
ncbi:MAG: cyclic nucleotide-binding domain-containing protein [Candidatus Omnitrophota bacterium]